MSIWFVVLNLLLASQPAPREVMLLDLAAVAPTSGSSTLSSESTPLKMRNFSFRTTPRGVTMSGYEAWPIQTTILAVERGERTDEWIVELRLQALREVMLPCSLTNSDVDPDPTKPLPSYRQMIFLVELGGPRPARATSVSGRAVYGSHLVPGSLVTLQPGDSVRVRFRTYAHDVIQHATADKPIPVRGLVYTFAGSRGMPSLRSANVIDVAR